MSINDLILGEALIPGTLRLVIRTSYIPDTHLHADFLIEEEYLSMDQQARMAGYSCYDEYLEEVESI